MAVKGSTPLWVDSTRSEINEDASFSVCVFDCYFARPSLINTEPLADWLAGMRSWPTERRGSFSGRNEGQTETVEIKGTNISTFMYCLNYDSFRADQLVWEQTDLVSLSDGV